MIVSQRVFAEMCGVSPPAISDMISRGKLVCINRKIDTEVSENKTYLAKKTLKTELNKTFLSIDPIETRREYCKKNADKMSEYQREYRQKNADKMSEYQRERYYKNQDKMREYQREYQQKNADKIREYHVKWNQKPESKTLEHIKRIREKTGAPIYRRDLDDATFQAIHATYMLEKEIKNIQKSSKADKKPLDNKEVTADNVSNP